MPEAGNATFTGRAQFSDLIRKSARLVQVLERVKDARERASGPIDIDVDARALRQRVVTAVRQATAGVEGEVEIHAETRGLRGEVARAVRAAASGVDADVSVGADTSQFQREMRTITAAGRTGMWKVEIPAGLRGADFIREVNRMVDLAEAQSDEVTVEIDGDGSRLIRDSRRARAAAEAATGPITVEMDVDASGLRATVSAAVTAAAVGQSINVPLNIGGGGRGGGLGGGALGGMGRGMATILKVAIGIPAVITGIQLLVGALSALGAAAVAAASMLGPLLGTLAAMPGVLSGVVGAVSAVALAFSGVGDALKAYGQSQDSAARRGAQAANQERQRARAIQQAARGIRDAQEGLADAYKRAGEMREQAARRVEQAARAVEDAERGVERAHRGVADALRRLEDANRGVVDAIRGVARAERNVEQAQKRALRAQRDLNRAREEAAERLRELRKEAQRDALDERRAVLNIEQARRRLAETMADPEASDLDRMDAILDLEEAELDLRDVQDDRAKNVKELNEREQKGIDGTDEVIDAKERLADAEQAATDAAWELEEAHRAVADAQRDVVDAVRAVADAQRELRDAQDGVGEAAIDAARLVRDAQENLADAYAAMADAQAAALDPGAVDPFLEAMAKLPPSAQEFVKFLIGLKPLLDRLRTIASDNLFPGLTAGIQNVVTMMPIAERLTARFAREVGEGARRLSTLALDPKFRREFEILGNSGAGFIRDLFDAMRPLIQAFVTLGAAAAPLVDWLGEWINKLANGINSTVQAGQASGKLARFFEEVAWATENLLGGIGNLIRGLINVGKVAYDVMGRDMIKGIREAGDEFREWTASTEGKNKIREWFESAKPSVEALGRLFRELVAIFIRLGANEQLPRLIDRITNELLPILEQLLSLDSGGFADGILDIVIGLAQIIATISDGGGPFKHFIDLLGTVMRALGWLVDNVPGANVVMQTLFTIVAAIAAIRFIGFVTGITSVVKTIGGISKGLRDVEGASDTMSGKVGKALRSIVTGAKDAALWLGRAAVESAKFVAGKIRDLAVALADVAKRAAAAAIELAKTAVQAAKTAATAVVNGIKNLATAVWDIAKRGAEAAVQLAKMAIEAGRAAAAAIVNGIKSLATAVADIARQGVAAATQLAKMALEAGRAAAAAIVTGMKNLATFVADIARQAARAAIEVAKLAIELAKVAARAIVSGVQSLATAFRTLGSAAVGAMRGIGAAMLANPWLLIIAAVIAAIVLLVIHWDTVTKAISDAWNWLWEQGRKIWTAISATISTIIESIRNWIATRLEAIRAIWSTIWGAVSERARQIWEGIKGAVALAIDAVRDRIDRGLQRVRQIWDSIWGGISGAFGGIWNTIESAVRNGVNGIIRILNTLISGANAVLRRLPGGFQIPEITWRMAAGGEVPPGMPGRAVPGVGHTDKVPALLMPGEYVNTKAVVRREGVGAFEALNRGEATIARIERRKRQAPPQRFARGGHVGRARGVQRFARGGLVGWLSDRGEDILGALRRAGSGAIRALWNAAKSAGEAGIRTMPGQDLIPGAVGAGSGRKMLAGIDTKVQELLVRLEGEENAKARAQAVIRAQRAEAQRQAAITAGGQQRVARHGLVVPTQPLLSGKGQTLVRALQQAFPGTGLHRVSPTEIIIKGGPTDQIARFILKHQKALRVAKLINTGAYSMNASVYHAGGGVSVNPSKEVLALLQRGEGVASVKAMDRFDAALSTPFLGPTSQAPVYISIEINNPKGEPSEESIHRSLQKLALHGVLPNMGANA